MRTHTFLRSYLFAFLWFGFVALAFSEEAAVEQPLAENISVPADGDSIPMLDFGGRPVVEVMIDGKGPHQFIIDTGADQTVLDPALAEELSLAGGAKIRELRVSKTTIRELPVLLIPIPRRPGDTSEQPRGVLSASAFPGNLVSFDYPAKQIRLRKGRLGEANGKNIFSYEASDLPSVPVKVAGREISLHLDTGAPMAVALPTKYMKELPLAAPAEQKGTARTVAGASPVFVAVLDSEISIGEFALPTRDLRFSDVVPEAGDEPRGQIGNQALREFVVTLDSLNRRVKLERAAQ